MKKCGIHQKAAYFYASSLLQPQNKALTAIMEAVSYRYYAGKCVRKRYARVPETETLSE